MGTLKIGMFDSGIGGFSILREVNRLLPNAEIHYIADDEFAPYGLKSREQIIARSSQNCEILLSRGVNLIVVACNTATAVAIEDLRKQYSIPFVGVEPYINILNQIDKTPEQNSPKCAVITTELTGKSQKFLTLKERLDPSNQIEHFMLRNLATLVEEVYHQGSSSQLLDKIQAELAPLKNKGFQYLILGCTHYPLIKEYIEAYLNVQAVCPGNGVARQTKVLAERLAEFESYSTKQQYNFYFMQTTKREWFLIPNQEASLPELEPRTIK